ncbi:MAG: hypothetical protein J7K09_09940 [Desulfuromusa sp.]|nr:hypothetical protein [Desulfuromusa sp.]
MHFCDVFRARIRIKKKFIKKLGYLPNFKKPRSYCEKIQWLKLNHINFDKRVIERADKYAVRNFLVEKGFGRYLVSLYGSWDKPEDIDWGKLPRKFILKLNNGSGSKYLWFVKDKSDFSITEFEKNVRKTMLVKFGHRNGQFHYGKISVKIIAEEYLEENGRPIKDYKFYCFHGKIAFLSVEEGKREGCHVREYYNLKWERNPVDFFNDVPRPSIPFVKPDGLQEMVHIAETLSLGYPHIRVDLYYVNGAIYFGELTYTPENGFTQWKPQSLDFEYGKLMDINNITH